MQLSFLLTLNKFLFKQCTVYWPAGRRTEYLDCFENSEFYKNSIKFTYLTFKLAFQIPETYDNKLSRRLNHCYYIFCTFLLWMNKTENSNTFLFLGRKLRVVLCKVLACPVLKGGKFEFVVLPIPKFCLCCPQNKRLVPTKMCVWMHDQWFLLCQIWILYECKSYDFPENKKTSGKLHFM